MEGSNNTIVSIEPAKMLQDIYDTESNDIQKCKEDLEAKRKLERNRELGRQRTRRYRERMALKKMGIPVKGRKLPATPEDSKKKLEMSRQRAVIRSRNYRARVKNIRELEKTNTDLRKKIDTEERVLKMMRSQQILYMANRDLQRQRSIIEFNNLFRFGVGKDNSELRLKQEMYTKLFYAPDVKNLNVGYSGRDKHLEYGSMYRDMYPRIEQKLVSIHSHGDDQEIVSCTLQFNITYGRKTLESLYPHLFEVRTDAPLEKNGEMALVPKPQFQDIVNIMDGVTVEATACQKMLFSGSQVVATECVIDYTSALTATLNCVRKVALLASKKLARGPIKPAESFNPSMILSQAK